MLPDEPVDEFGRLVARCLVLEAENEQLWTEAARLVGENDRLRARVGKLEGLLEEDQPLGSGDPHVSSFIATSESEIAEMNVESFFSYEVRIEGRSVSLLKGIVREIYRVLVECETGKPPSLFATYPL